MRLRQVKFDLYKNMGNCSDTVRLGLLRQLDNILYGLKSYPFEREVFEDVFDRLLPHKNVVKEVIFNEINQYK